MSVTETIISEVEAECFRQYAPISSGGESYSAEHDDQHSDDAQLARAGAAYALLAAGDRYAASDAWPWTEPIKPKTARRDLVVACALLVREIGRLDRVEGRA